MSSTAREVTTATVPAASVLGVADAANADTASDSSGVGERERARWL